MTSLEERLMTSLEEGLVVIGRRVDDVIERRVGSH